MKDLQCCLTSSGLGGERRRAGEQDDQAQVHQDDDADQRGVGEKTEQLCHQNFPSVRRSSALMGRLAAATSYGLDDQHRPATPGLKGQPGCLPAACPSWS